MLSTSHYCVYSLTNIYNTLVIYTFTILFCHGFDTLLCSTNGAMLLTSIMLKLCPIVCPTKNWELEHCSVLIDGYMEAQSYMDGKWWPDKKCVVTNTHTNSVCIWTFKCTELTLDKWQHSEPHNMVSPICEMPWYFLRSLWPFWIMLSHLWISILNLYWPPKSGQ